MKLTEHDYDNLTVKESTKIVTDFEHAVSNLVAMLIITGQQIR